MGPEMPMRPAEMQACNREPSWRVSCREIRLNLKRIPVVDFTAHWNMSWLCTIAHLAFTQVREALIDESPFVDRGE
jgi:hypothetical protein